jgi:MFS family permease
MLPLERRASLSLASIFALRMLGLFLVLPVFSLEAQKYPGGQDATLIGLALGVYGLTQALLQLPLGMASDRLGRKPVIAAGLLVFVVGSVLAATAGSIEGLIVGRAIQGAGAVSAAVTAMLADQTRDEVRTKGMALVGGSIALMFAVSLVAAPLLAGAIGLAGLFWLTAALAVGAIAVVVWWVPPESTHRVTTNRKGASLASLLKDPALNRLFFGVFVLHAVQLAMWMVVPALLVQAGLDKAHQWQVYLPAVLLSFTALGGLFALERRGHQKRVLIGAIALLALVQLGFWAQTGRPSLYPLALCLLLFFVAFNILEASQPSLTSKLAPTHSRGTALGIYNTLQSLGLFVGGAAGGWAVKALGPSTLFLICAVAVGAWGLLSLGLRVNVQITPTQAS